MDVCLARLWKMQIGNNHSYKLWIVNLLFPTLFHLYHFSSTDWLAQRGQIWSVLEMSSKINNTPAEYTDMRNIETSWENSQLVFINWTCKWIWIWMWKSLYFSFYLGLLLWLATDDWWYLIHSTSTMKFNHSGVYTMGFLDRSYLNSLWADLKN